MINEFKKLNPEFKLIKFNFFNKESVKSLKYPKQLTESNVNSFHKELKTKQRLARLVNGNEDLTEQLYEKGFHSAYQIASMHRKEFIALTKDIFANFRNIKPETVYKNALASKVKSTLDYTAVTQHKAPHYRVSKFNNYQELTDKNFSDLPSYEDLFGGLNFCHCKDCRSVLSPAAYFVDLMRLQSRYLATTPDESHTLESRRGDLWDLELSCDNTNTMIPKLEIVNKVLLNRLYNSKFLMPVIPTGIMQGEDRDYEPLDSIIYPFNLPFNLPLTKIRKYLTAAKTNLSDVWHKIGGNNQSEFANEVMALEILGLSPKQWKICSTELKENDDNIKLLAGYYGLEGVSARDELISELQKVSRFLEQTGLDRKQLNTLLLGDLNLEEQQAKINNKFFINATGELDPMVISSSDELIENLTFARLDRLNRFIRLTRALNWSFIDTDWAIRTTDSAKDSVSVNLDPKSVFVLAFISRMLKTESTISMDQICSFIALIRDFGKKEIGGEDFFDTIYNSSNVANSPQWKDSNGEYKLEWVVPVIGNASDGYKKSLEYELNQQIQSALTSALRINLDDLIIIANNMIEAQAVQNKKLILTLSNLSILYRVSMLSNIIGLSINEILTALKLQGDISGIKASYLKLLFSNDGNGIGVCQLSQWLINYAQNIVSSKFSTEGLQYAITGDSNDIAIRNQILSNDSVQNFLASFYQDIKGVLVNKENLYSILSSVLLQPQYSDTAVYVVYNKLVDGGYIDKDGKVLKEPSTQDEIIKIVKTIFPANQPSSDLNVKDLSDSIITLLKDAKEEKSKLLEVKFAERLKGDFLSYMRWDGMFEKIWQNLLEAKVINSGGVVINTLQDYVKIISGTLFPIMLFPIKEGEKQIESDAIMIALRDEIISLISNYITNCYESQQSSLNQHLAGLFSISAEMFNSLIVWQGLSIGDIDANQAIEKVKGNNYYASVPLLNCLLEAAGKDISNRDNAIIRLRLLQHYVYLSKQLLLSPAEIDNIRYYPECYGISYLKAKEKTIANQFTLQNIFLINDLKGLIQQFKDAQNLWINYLSTVQQQFTSLDINVAHKISEITGWDANQIVFLMRKLWSEEAEHLLRPWGTVEGISILQQWFTVAGQLNLDIPVLWKIYELSDAETGNKGDIYGLYSSIAGALWGSLTALYQNDLRQLSQIRGVIEEKKRTALVDLVIKSLKKDGIPVETARDLYEYLLIDVEISGVVETSKISEAISAVQLYLHRCRNHLEKGVSVQNELGEWWDWIENYRVWEANRQVFLYPENYIEPDLRKKKTQLFSRLENDLQQLNLKDEGAVEAAFNGYMDNFLEIADLELLGVAARRLGSTELKKEYFFIGYTAQESRTYYYRTVIFGKDEKSEQYFPIEWNPWVKIDTAIQALGPVQPTFAFGKWFIFWIEQNQSGTATGSGSEASPQYSTTIKFSYLNLNGTWAPVQSFGKPVKLKQDIEGLEKGNKEYWDMVYPVYFSSSQTLVVPYQANDKGKDKEYTDLIIWNQGGLNKNLSIYVKYSGGDNRYRKTPLASQVTANNEKSVYQYWNQFYQEYSIPPAPVSLVTFIPIPKDSLSLEKGFTLSTWFKENTVTENYLPTIIYLTNSNNGQEGYVEVYLNEARCITFQSWDGSKYSTQAIENTTKWQQLAVKYIPSWKYSIDYSELTIYSNELLLYRHQYYMIWVSYNTTTQQSSINISKYFPEKENPIAGATQVSPKPIDLASAALGGSLITVTGKDKLNFYFVWQNTAGDIKISEILLDEATPKLSDPIQLNILLSSDDPSLPDFAVIDNQVYALWSDENKNITLGYIDPKSGAVNNIIQLKDDTGQFIKGKHPAITASRDQLHLVWLSDDKIIQYSNYIPTALEANITVHNLVADVTYSEPKMISLQFIGKQLFIVWLNEAKENIVIEAKRTKLYCAIINNNQIQLKIEIPEYKAGTWTNISQVANEVYVLSGGIGLLLSRLGQLQTFLDGEHFETLITNPVNKTFTMEKLYLGYSPTQGTGGVVAWNSFMQETLLYDRIVSDAEINLLYKNSKHQITEDLGMLLGNSPGDGSTNYIQMLQHSFFNAQDITDVSYVLDEPNSVAVSGNGIKFLNIFYNDKDIAGKHFQSKCYRLNTTAASKLAESMFITGIKGLYNIEMQKSPEIPFVYLKPNTDYVPVNNWPLDTIDFNPSSATSQYYWEIFFHSPFIIANVLKNQQQFAEAKSWYEYIFNPVVNDKLSPDSASDDNRDTPYWRDRYWGFIGLHSFNNPILKKELDQSWADEMRDDLNNQSPQLYQYHSDPFDPHAIAMLRPIAYQKSIVMHYLNNIMSWADNLFRQYTTETILEATMLYIMVYDLLGKQPFNLGECPLPESQTLREIMDRLKISDPKGIPEFLIILEQLQQHVVTITAKDNPNNYIIDAYFGLPDNSQFISYWDRIKQALYNIRHGLNIDGVRQQLDLFAPSLNPMELVQQIGSGGGLSSALSELKTQIPYYRFEVMIQRAKTLTQTVVQFGQSLLSAIEKRDSEQLLLLNHVNEQNILSLTESLKEAALLASENTIDSLKAALKNAEDRIAHYGELITQGLSAGEISQLTLDSLAITLQTTAQPLKAIAAVAYPVPNIYGTSIGGGDIGAALNQSASILEGSAFVMNMSSGLSAATASYQRRAEDWELQVLLAEDDKKQIEDQILGAIEQKNMAAQDLKILKTNINQEKDVQMFLMSKFTNEQLYQWMVGKLSSLYFCAYQLAYNLAIQAEQAWKFEKGISANFIKQNYWNNLNHGLITGEILQLDLERMENAYMEQNQRRFEIQKTISLKKKLGEEPFTKMIKSGSWLFDITEEDFNADYPGHYCRQIKTISLSLPVLIGPYQNIRAILTQLANKTVLKPDANAVEYLNGKSFSSPDSSVLRVNLMANQQIALSQGLNDNGLFMLNFNDERYLPFEGTGAISTWKLELSKGNQDVDFNNLSDVIIQLSYTALAGNAAFASSVAKKTR